MSFQIKAYDNRTVDFTVTIKTDAGGYLQLTVTDVVRVKIGRAGTVELDLDSAADTARWIWAAEYSPRNAWLLFRRRFPAPEDVGASARLASSRWRSTNQSRSAAHTPPLKYNPPIKPKSDLVMRTALLS